MSAATPSLEEFLAAPIEQVAPVAPATLIFAPGGTRRRAMLAGIAPHSEEYARWSREQMIACSALWFQHGVRHLFMNVLRPSQLEEVGYYRRRVLSWLEHGLAGPGPLEDYRRRDWRVRLIGAETLPELHDAAARLREATAQAAGPTLWFLVAPTPDAPWQLLQAALRQAAAPTMAEAIRALYGEPVPPATMFVGFGKPLLAPELLPPLLAGDLQCYWTQRPGYDLDANNLRRILYDYAYVRSTWTADKSSRYDAVPEQRSLWERPLVLGLGRREGAFWYPQQEHDQDRTTEQT
ncbi:MAG: hypothetical protein IPO81_10980 [Kouleothrix sp.]|nr:hypothetical protein [Kouleothrix sp.]